MEHKQLRYTMLFSFGFKDPVILYPIRFEWDLPDVVYVSPKRSLVSYEKQKRQQLVAGLNPTSHDTI